MLKGILGKKLGMTQRFSEDGTLHAITVIQAGPCTVTQVKTLEKDGYQAVQIGYGDVKRISKPMKGHFGSMGPFRHLREFRVDDLEGVERGARVEVTIFERHRAPGSVGAGTTPGRVTKGFRMAGHMGNRRVTARKLTVLAADQERGLLLIKGAVPGALNGLVVVRKSEG